MNIKQKIDASSLIELVKVSDISDIWIVHGKTSDEKHYYDIKYILNGYSGTSCEASARFWDERSKPQKVLLKILKAIRNSKQSESEYLVVFTNDILLSSEIDLDD